MGEYAIIKIVGKGKGVDPEVSNYVVPELGENKYYFLLVRKTFPTLIVSFKQHTQQVHFQ